MFCIRPTLTSRRGKKRFLDHDFRLTVTEVFRRAEEGAGANRRALERGGRPLRTPGAPCTFHRVARKSHPIKLGLQNYPASSVSLFLRKSASICSNFCK